MPRDGKIQKYKLDRQQYEEICKKQKGLCAICPKKLEVGFSKHKHIDHDHEKNLVRGVLCGSCNLMLGHAKDSVETLRKAIKYLKKYE